MKQVIADYVPMRATRWLRQSGAPVFMLHRVLPAADAHTCYDPEMVTSVELLDHFFAWLSEEYDVVPLEDLVRGIETRGRRRALCALTFDDGWRDNYEHAWPLLKKYRFPATIFLPVCFIGSRRRFWQERLWLTLHAFNDATSMHMAVDRAARLLPWCPQPPIPNDADAAMAFAGLRQLLLARASHDAEEFAKTLEKLSTAALPDTPAFMSWDEVREMQAGGINFGSHTANHALLTTADPDSIRCELSNSREEIHLRLGVSPAAFSYPWGANCKLVSAQVEAAGYEFAVSIRERMFTGREDRFSIPRIPISSAILRDQTGSFARNKTSLYVASRALARNRADNNLNRPVRVAFVADQIHYWDGGTEQQLGKMISALDRKFFEPEIYLLTASLVLQAKDFPCPVHMVDPPPGRLRRFQVLRELTAQFLRRQPDIVQNFFTGATVYGTLAARVAGVPIVINSKRNMRQEGAPWAYNLARRLTGFWQCNSRAIWELLRAESIAPGRIEILPNGIDVTRFRVYSQEERLAARRQLELQPETPVFVVISNLRPVKDIPTVLEAARLVVQNEPDVQFLLVGDGPLRNEVARLIDSLGISGNVRMMGVQSDVRQFLAAADIGILASRSEGCANSLLEYMATGLPAVVSDIAPNRELVDEVIFETGNPVDLAAKLLSLWRDPERRAQLAVEYRNRAMHFSLDACARRTQGYYLKLVADHVREAA